MVLDNIDDAVAGMWDRATSEHADSRAHHEHGVSEVSRTELQMLMYVIADYLALNTHYAK